MRACITAAALFFIASVLLFFPVCTDASGSPGDMNRDGNVDLADTALALQVLSGMKPVVDSYLDINGDSRLGTEEAIYILQKFSGFRTDAGDINADGNVDIRDAMLALKILSGMNPGYVYPGADINGDKRISIDEVFFILQTVSGAKSKRRYKEAVSDSINMSTGRRRSFEISLQTTTNVTLGSEYLPGYDLYLNINLAAGSDGIAGCAFTLTYPSDLLTAPLTNPSNLPDSASSPDITSIFPFMIAGKYSRCENSSEGKIMFAGAEITAKGCSKAHTEDVTLFTVKFKVKNYADGDIKFELMQTQLINSDAGWNGDGVPVLVGAIPDDDPNFGGDLSDDFPVLMGNFSVNPTVTCRAGPGPFIIPPHPIDFSMDIDGSGEATLGGDAMLLIRWMAGFTGNSLTDGLVDTADCTRCTADEISAYIDKYEDIYDVDGSGQTSLSEDCMMIIRYMTGFRGDAMIGDSLDKEYCTRCNADEISEYIRMLIPD